MQHPIGKAGKHNGVFPGPESLVLSGAFSYRLWQENCRTASTVMVLRGPKEHGSVLRGIPISDSVWRLNLVHPVPNGEAPWQHFSGWLAIFVRSSGIPPKRRV